MQDYRKPWYVPDEVTVYAEWGDGGINNVGPDNTERFHTDEEVLGIALTYYAGGPREVITYESRADFRNRMLALDQAELDAQRGVTNPDGLTFGDLQIGGTAASIISLGIVVLALLTRRKWMPWIGSNGSSPSASSDS